MSASLQHILISIEEYDRLKEIESQYEQLHKEMQKNLQIPKHIEEIENDKGEGHNSLHHSKPHQIGSGQTSEEQIGLGESATTNLIENNEFLSKIAYLVTKKIYPRLPESTWSNFNLTLPNSTAIESENTVAPLHYDNIKQKNDENDIYDEKRLINLTPQKYRKKAALLLKEFSRRGNELTWSTDGIIYVDEISIPSTDIYVLFPYLFKAKRPKNLPGFEDFVQKINCMGLNHLIYQKPKLYECSKSKNNPKPTENLANWWYLN